MLVSPPPQLSRSFSLISLPAHVSNVSRFYALSLPLSRRQCPLLSYFVPLLSIIIWWGGAGIFEVRLAMAVSTSWCVGAFPAQQRHQHTSPKLGSSPAILHSPRPRKYRGQAKPSRRVCSVAVLPLYSLAEQLPDFEFTSFYDDWMPDEKLVKNIYLCFSLFFVWGCCVFGSMKDPFYDSDLYRDAGGDGSGNWVYKLEEEEEMQAREELWREELEREMEERVEELRELEEGQKEKELV